jgi:hypothetical protein
MKVKDLIWNLGMLDEDLEVYTSSDAEGNAIHEVECAMKEEKYGGGYAVIIWPEHGDVELF